MRKQIVLVLLVPILALTLISCDADMRSSFADFLGVFGGNVYIDGGLVEANKEEAKAAASTVASLGATGTATVTGGGTYTGFGITVDVPAGVTTVMPPQSKDDRDKLNDELADIIASSQLTGFKEEMSHKVEDADRKEAVKGTVATFNNLVEDLGNSSPELADVFGSLSFEVDEDELTEADVLVVQMMVNMVSTTIGALQDIAGEGKEIKDLKDDDIEKNKDKLLDVIDEILFVAEVVGELSGASSLDLLQGIDIGSLFNKGMRGSRDGRDSDDDFDFSVLKHLGPQLVTFFKIKKGSGDTYTWADKDYKRFLREQKIFVSAIDQALVIIERAKYDEGVIRERVDLFDETTTAVYTLGALLNKLESIPGLEGFGRKYIEAFFTSNPTFADGTFADAAEWVEPTVGGETFEEKMDAIFGDSAPEDNEHEADAKKIISNMMEILTIGGFEALMGENPDADDIYDKLFGTNNSGEGE